MTDLPLADNADSSSDADVTVTQLPPSPPVGVVPTVAKTYRLVHVVA